MQGTHARREPVTWTAEEDETLREWQGKLGNRHGHRCLWKPHSRGLRGNPEISKAKWSHEEDDQLQQLVEAHGSSWALIARNMPGRTDQQCMGRWRRHLDPSISFHAWQRWEDKRLQELWQEHGMQWSKIAYAFGNRTSQQCRARWVSLTKDGECEATAARDKVAQGCSLKRRKSHGSSAATLIHADIENARPASRKKVSRAVSATDCAGTTRMAARKQPADENSSGEAKPRKKPARSRLSSPRLPCDVHVPRRPRGSSGLVLQPLQAAGNVPRPAGNILTAAASGSSALVNMQPPLAGAGRLFQQGSEASMWHEQSTSRSSSLATARSLRSRTAQQSVPVDSGSDSQGRGAAVLADALFFWLQLLLLRPLQPVMADLDRSLTARLHQLASLSALTFVLFCCPFLARRRRRRVSARRARDCIFRR